MGINAHGGIVDPCIDSAIAFESSAGQAFNLFPDRHVSDDHLSLASISANLLGHVLERGIILRPRMTDAPRRANKSAVCLPMPDEAPVITTDYSLIGRIMNCLSVLVFVRDSLRSNP